MFFSEVGLFATFFSRGAAGAFGSPQGNESNGWRSRQPRKLAPEVSLAKPRGRPNIPSREIAWGGGIVQVSLLNKNWNWACWRLMQMMTTTTNLLCAHQFRLLESDAEKSHTGKIDMLIYCHMSSNSILLDVSDRQILKKFLSLFLNFAWKFCNWEEDAFNFYQ